MRHGDGLYLPRLATSQTNQLMSLSPTGKVILTGPQELPTELRYDGYIGSDERVIDFDTVTHTGVARYLASASSVNSPDPALNWTVYQEFSSARSAGYQRATSFDSSAVRARFKASGSAWGPWRNVDGDGDNLGNAVAKTRVNLNGNWLSGSDDDQGLFIAADGKLGVGTTTPTQALDVRGKIAVSDNLGNVLIGNPSDTARTGSLNTAIGIGAGANVRESNFKTSIGSYAGTKSAGNGSVDIGAYAGETNSGENAVNIGFQSGLNNTGSNAVNIGFGAGKTNASAYSINIGASAGAEQPNLDSWPNINIGLGAGERETRHSGINIGTYAGQNNASEEGIRIGFRAGQNASALKAIIMGYDAGRNAETTDSPIFIGWGAGENAKGGYALIGIGTAALANNTDGRENVAIGEAALRANTSGFENTAIGVQSGMGNTTGSYNTYLGWRAGFVNNGDANVLIGESANDQAYNASSNVAIGRRVLHDNGSGSRNVAIGESAMHKSQSILAAGMVTGQEYMIFGGGSTDFTLIGATDNAIGTKFIYNGGPITGDSPVRSLTEGDSPNRNVALGYSAGANVGVSSGSVYLGYEAGPTPMSGSTSNRLFIDNSETDTPLIHGEFDNDKVTVNGSLAITNELRISSMGTGLVRSDSTGRLHAVALSREDILNALGSESIGVPPPPTTGALTGPMSIYGAPGSQQDGRVIRRTYLSAYNMPYGVSASDSSALYIEFEVPTPVAGQSNVLETFVLAPLLVSGDRILSEKIQFSVLGTLEQGGTWRYDLVDQAQNRASTETYPAQGGIDILDDLNVGIYRSPGTPVNTFVVKFRKAGGSLTGSQWVIESASGGLTVRRHFRLSPTDI